MKKYLKLQAKKTLSLMLAVLMLMSCWVWVAPEKAEAANSAADGYYQVRVYGSITKEADDVSSQQWAVTYKPDNGTGAEASTRVTLTNKYDLKSTQSGVVLAEGWVPGWPTIGHVSINASTSGCNEAKPRIVWRWEVYNNTTGTWVIMSVGDNAGKEYYEGAYGSDFTASYDHGLTVAATPKITEVTVNLSKTSLTIPNIDKTTTDSLTVSRTVKDQYGVTWKAATKNEYYFANASGNKYDNTKEDGAWVEGTSAEGNTAYINANFQKTHTSTTDSTSHYIYCKVNESDEFKSSAAVTVNYPKYTLAVNPDGQTGTTGAKMTMSDGDTQTGEWKVADQTYGTKVDEYPETATKSGYTFMGFFTKQQPASGDTGFNALEADFVKPISSTKFESYKTQIEAGTGSEGDKVEGDYVTFNGVKYFNAGDEWPAANKQVVNTVTYYGWWLAKDVTAKFYDVDGKYLGTRTYKNGVKPGVGDYPNPKDEYQNGSYTYETFSGVWQDITGVKVTEGSYTFGTGGLYSLSLTPLYTTKEYKPTYKIEFINPLNGTVIEGPSKDYAYRYILGSEVPQDEPLTTAMKNDYGYSYEFIGWSNQAPSSGNYHVIEERNKNFEVNTDWVVREDMTYYAVYRSYVKKYAVQFNYTDSTGAAVSKRETVEYGSLISTPSYVNRTYAAEGMEYVFEGWKYQNKILAADESVLFNNTNFTLAGNNLEDGDNVTPILFAADYDDGTPMPYTVTFKYKNGKGEEVIKTTEVSNGFEISKGTDEFGPDASLDDKLNVPAEYDDGTALYTFANTWKITDGTDTGSKTVYTKEELLSFKPASHVTFEAVYDDGVPFYTVTYTDGAKTYSERILKGSNVPAWMVETGEIDENGKPITEEYVPADYDGDGGKFKFAGWYDEEQTDKTFNEINGTKYTTASIVEGDLNLYAQYKFEATKYIIRFMDYTGKVQLGIAEVEKGQSFADAFYWAQKAAISRPADDTYTYTFIGWDQPYNEDNLVCEGKDVTYIAQYRANYIYYEAEWYADDSMTGDPLETTSHTYNSKLYSPSVDFTGVAPLGKVFDGWYYLKDGVETAYQRGMFITSDMEFYAKYKDATVTYTVTTVVDGKSTEYTVAKDALAKAVPTPADGYVDETKHNKFEGWYKTADYAEGTEFDIENTAITGNITIYAKLKEEAHIKGQKNILTYPTYYAKGSEEIWCACSKATAETKEIPMLTDIVAPTGTIYLGTQGKWSSSDAQSGAADTNKYYANEDTDVILTINDTGDVDDLYNPSGKGIGIRMIRAFVSSDTFTADQQGIASQLAITIFTDNSQEQNNTANYTFKVGDLVTADLDADGNVQYEADGTTIKTKSLEDGKEYIIYYYAVDKDNNVLNSKVRTAKFTYDATAPEFEITGESNAATATGTVTYCDEATVTDIETGATVTVNGEEVTFSGSTYTIAEAGNYVIKVTDEAGNSSTKKIVVTDGHTEVTVEKKVTCDEDGYKKVTCAICGKIISEITTKTEGHKWEFVETKAATCNAKGYTLQQCTVCGEKQKINETDKLAHEYAKDADGNIIYTVVTKATCKAEGKKIANCTLCGAGTLTEVIPVDADAHVYGGIKILKPTCTEDGKYYQTCKYCYTVKNGDPIPATGHEDEVVTVTVQATCYSEGVKTVTCKACGTLIRTETIATIAHTLKLVEYTDVDTFTDEDKEAYPNGYMQYECQASGCTHTEGKEAIKPLPKFTVKFFAEGAKEGDAPLYTITKTQGDSISTTDVPDQKKNADNTYNYTFAGWKNKADGKVVNLPLTVTADAEYTAEFAKSTIIYTHIFMVPTKWVATLGADDQSYVTFASMMGKYEDTNKVPAAIPTFSDADEKTDEELKKLYTFEFSYWALSDGTKVTDFTMYGNETFYAVFEAKSIEYDVIFYSGNDYIATKTVDGGETVELIKTTDAQAADIKKAPTDTQHYSFNGNWYTDAEGKNIFTASTKIIENTRLYAGFAAEDHNWVVDAESAENKAATCYEAQKVAYKCACGATKVEAVGEKLEHDMGEYVYNEETGYNEATCKREGCGYTHRVKASYTIKFLNENGVALISPITVKANGEATYTGETPTKAATAQYTYEFAGWLGEDGTRYAKDHKFTGIVEDATYTAYYTEITRTFRVSYLDVNGKVIQTQAGIAYGAAIPAYTGEVPTKNYDDTYHYAFNKWSVANDAVVTADLAITPVFEAIEHDYDAGTVTNATCDKDGGLTKKCKTCGHSFVSKDIVPATGHKYDYNNPVVTEPNYTTGADGERRFYCKNGCGKYESEVIYAYIDLVVNVKDSNGNPREGVKVALVYANDVTKPVEGTRTLTSGADGKVTFRVRPGEYKALIDSDYIEIDVNDANKDQSADFTQGSAPEQEAPSCSCSCHRDSLWGTIFRFFHKIIKFFTGKIRCCSCPDSRY